MAIWLYKIDLKDVWHNDELSFEEKRNEIVKRLRDSSWFKDSYSFELEDLIDWLELTGNVQEFDHQFRYIYDLADEDRTWIETF